MQSKRAEAWGVWRYLSDVGGLFELVDVAAVLFAAASRRRIKVLLARLVLVALVRNHAVIDLQQD
jgi:hypothetical protein